MSGSLTLTSAEAYQDYVQEFQEQLLSQMFLSFKTSEVATVHQGLKGKKALTEMQVGELIQVWNKNYNATAALDFVPRELETFQVKVDLSIYPQEFHTSYLGALRPKGVDQYTLPFPQFIIDKLSKKMDAEKELAAWRAKRAGTVNPGDALNLVVTGYQEIMKAEIAATNSTPVVTGAITNANAIDKAELVFAAIGSVYQEKELIAFVSPSHMIKLKQNYYKDYGKFVGATGEDFKLPIGNVTFSSHAGIVGDFMMVTMKDNLHYGFAPEGDIFTFEKHKRELAIFSDFWIGFQLAMINDEVIRTNDQDIS